MRLPCCRTKKGNDDLSRPLAPSSSLSLQDLEALTSLPTPQTQNDSSYSGPDTTGYFILIPVVLFFIYCGFVFFATSNIDRIRVPHLETTRDIINNAFDTIFPHIFAIPVQIIILTSSLPQHTDSSPNHETFNPDELQSIRAAFTSQLQQTTEELLVPDGSSPQFDISIQICALNSTAFQKISASYLRHYLHYHQNQHLPIPSASALAFDDAVHAFIMGNESYSIYPDGIQFVISPLDITQSLDSVITMGSRFNPRYAQLPPALLSEQLKSDQVYLGAHSHSFTLLSSPVPTLASHVSTQQPTAFFQSFNKAVWTQLQPALLFSLFPEQSSLSQSKSRPIAHACFQQSFGLSIEEYLALRAPVATAYQLDISILSQLPHANALAHAIARDGSASSSSSSSSSLKHEFMLSSPLTSFPTDVIATSLEIIQLALSPVIHLSTAFIAPPSLDVLHLDEIDPQSISYHHIQAKSSSSQHDTNNLNVFLIPPAALHNVLLRNPSAWQVAHLDTPELISYTPIVDVDLTTSRYTFSSTSQRQHIESNTLPSPLSFVGVIPHIASYHHKLSSSLPQDQVIIALDTPQHRTTVHSLQRGQQTSSTTKQHLVDPTSNTIQLPQSGNIFIVPPTSLSQEHAVASHLVSQLKAFLGIGILPQHEIQHPASYAVLPTWQRMLFYRSAAIGYLINARHQILTATQLAIEATHMPFPADISNALHHSIDLIQAIGCEYATHQQTTFTPEPKQVMNATINAANATQVEANPSASALASARDSYLLFGFSSAVLAMKLASAVASHHDLLPQSHFPFDQLLAVYAPMFLPMLVPLLSALIKTVIAKCRRRRKS